jgi:uncharacterized protein (TIGR03790 family)
MLIPRIVAELVPVPGSGCYHRAVVLLLWLLLGMPLLAQTGENVLLVVNSRDAASREIAEYYRPRRSVPLSNVCSIETTPQEEIDWQTYQREIEQPVARCLKKAHLEEKVLYIVTTAGVPLKVSGGGSGLAAEQCAVDSELALLYGKMKGVKYPRGGGVPNPFFRNRDAPFQHPRFAEYLVTRLAAYDVAGVKALIDRSLAARNRGRFVVDLKSDSDEPGNDWLRTAGILLPAGRVVMDESTKVLYDLQDVIGYASWGSNDPNRKRRRLGFHWLPGAIAMEFVSTSARTLRRPPENWTYVKWADRSHFFAGSPQGLSGDALDEGATGTYGNVYEPYLLGCARPDYVLPAYFHGRNLAESFYMGLPYLSWQEVVLGDPLCSIGK